MHDWSNNETNPIMSPGPGWTGPTGRAKPNFTTMLTTMVLNYVYTFVISHSRFLESIFNQYAAKYSGLELLLDILESTSVKQKGNASAALHKLAAKASSSVSLFDAAPPSTSHQVCVRFSCLFILICFPYLLNRLFYVVIIALLKLV